jgi:putative ABC transport system permease protein
VNQNFFKVMGIPLISGRSFEERDGINAPPVIMINETMDRRFWPNEDAVGKRMKFASPESEDPWIEIIGVVGDVRRTGFDAEVRPETFLPHSQAPARGMIMVLRTDSDPAKFASSVRSAVRELDPDQPVFEVETMDATLGEMMAQRRLNMILFGVFAAAALLLASVGIYGIISHHVTERTHELGVRMALGASRREVLKLVLKQGMTLSGFGIGLGLGGAFGLTRVMSSLLYGVSATDPITFAAIALLLGIVALAACLIPARRATKVDPMIALRYE